MHNLIVDGGSYTNVDSTILVSKLSLPAQLPSQHCSLKLLNDVGDLKVIKLAFVSFPIRKKFKMRFLMTWYP